VKTIVIPPPGKLGVVTQPLTNETAVNVVASLAETGIYVFARPGSTVQLNALVPLTTRQRVRVTAAFRAVTDAPLHWRPIIDWDYAPAVAHA
jgi:hypothetical protein